MTENQDEYDSPWKEAISIYFPSCIAFFFPNIHERIDWSIPHEFLEKELQQVMRDDEIGDRKADKLVKIWLRDGSETWLLIHLEIQSQYQATFAERMYVYNSRIFGMYRKKVISLAILADERPHWRPTSYSYQMWGCEVSLKFPIVKLLDYQQDWENLEQNPNPFAPIIAAHLKTQETRQKGAERLQWKLSVVKSLYRRGYTQTEVRQLFRLIDWMMALPKNLETEFRQELEHYEEEMTMPYVTSVERLAREEGLAEGLERGLEQGLEQGLELGILQTARGNVIYILEDRFTEIPQELADRINQIEDNELLKVLLKRAFTITSLEGFGEAIDELTTEDEPEASNS